MPIIQERQTMQDLRAAGFTQQQAEVLTEKFEATAQATAQDLKSFIVTELDKRFGELDKHMDKRFAEVDKRFAEVDKRFAEVNGRFSEQEAKFEHALRVHLTTILTALVGLLGLAVAIIKLFPNAH